MASLIGTIAQLVEQRIENPRVPGSNPGSTTKSQLTLAFFVSKHGVALHWHQPHASTMDKPSNIRPVNHTIHFHTPEQAANRETLWNQHLSGAGIRILADERFRHEPIYNPLASIWDESPKCFIPAGEKSKSLEVAQQIWTWLDNEKTDRGHVLVIVGGGTISDLGGFVASTYKRGLPFIIVPTTIVGMIDASIGGKNGINFGHFKNQIGLFQLPDLTYVDTRFIASLDALERTNGWMELVKHSLIADSALWTEIRDLDIHKTGAIEPWIQRAALIKKEIVASDFMDKSERKALNFGHTLAHALEWKAKEDGITLGHGMAVGWGMIWSIAWSASVYPEQSDSFSQVGQKIRAWLEAIPNDNQSDWLVTLNPSDLWTAVLKDKKNRDGIVLDVMLEGIGRATWDRPLSLIQFTSIWKQVFQ